MRVEHNDRDAGTVTRSWIDDQGRAMVGWRLADEVPGWSLSQLIKKGAVTELSLKHVEFPDGSMQPVEVSIVLKGARPNCSIVAASARSIDHVRQLVRRLKAPEYIAASGARVEGGMEAAAAAPPAPEQAPAAEAHAHVEVDEDDERRKRMRMSAEAVMKATEAVLPLVQDAAVSHQLVASITEVLQQQLASEEAVGKKNAEMNALKETAGNAKVTQKAMAKEIVDGMSTLLAELFPERKYDEDDKNHMMQVYETNPRFAYLSQPMVVAASAMREKLAKVGADDMATKLGVAQNKMSEMAKQLAAFGSMTTVAASAAPVAPVAAAPVWPAAPAVMVAASAREETKLSLPAALANMAAYSGKIGTMSRNDLRIA